MLLLMVNCLVLYLLGVALFVANFWLAFLWKDLLKLTLSRSLLIFDQTGHTSYQLARLQVPPPPLNGSHVCGIIRPTDWIANPVESQLLDWTWIAAFLVEQFCTIAQTAINRTLQNFCLLVSHLTLLTAVAAVAVVCSWPLSPTPFATHFA